MKTFFGQPKFSNTRDTDLPIGYELFIREQCADQWCLPQDFCAITASEINELLTKTIAFVPPNIKRLSFNLEPAQFIDTQFIEMVAAVQQTTSVQLYTELTERADPNVSADQLLVAAKQFNDAGLLICMDDVGTGENSLRLALKLGDYVSEYKFALQNFRPFEKMADIEPELNFWYSMAQLSHKVFAIEGIESNTELAEVHDKYPCDVLQGYYTGRPVQLPVHMGN